jgi:serine/threonine-protein kinase
VPFAAETTVATLVGRLEKPLEAPPELGPLGPVVARAGRPDPTERLDAISFAAALQAVASELPAPEPLALAGPATFDMNHLAALDGDPTELGTAAPKPAPPKVPFAPPAPAPVPDEMTVIGAPAPAEAETRLTPALVEPDATPTTVINRPEVEKRRANRRGAEQAEVTAVLVSKKAGRRRRWPWVVLLVMALLGAGGAGAYLLVGDQVPSHPLPDVTQRDRATAEGALKAARFVVNVEERYVDATVPGIVTEQSPKAGTKSDGKPITLKEGKTVTLIVSKGPPPTAVPDLTDMTEAAARAKIVEVGHVVGDVAKPYSETVEAGMVIGWTNKGESPPKGATIGLTVSAGPAPRTVPTLSGRTYEQAVAALEAVGLKAARNPDQYSDDDSTKGKVILASPTQGSTVKRGDVISVTVSAGRPEVPSLNGLTVAEAEAKLATVGLKLDSKFGPTGGKVFLTTPSAGSKVSPGSSVDVFIL